MVVNDRPNWPRRASIEHLVRCRESLHTFLGVLTPALRKRAHCFSTSMTCLQNHCGGSVCRHMRRPSPHFYGLLRRCFARCCICCYYPRWLSESKLHTIVGAVFA